MAKIDPSESLYTLAEYLASRVNVREGASHACADLIEKGVDAGTLLQIGYSEETIKDAYDMIKEWEKKRKKQDLERKINNSEHNIKKVSNAFFNRIQYALSQENAAAAAQTLSRKFEAAANKYLKELNLPMIQEGKGE